MAGRKSFWAIERAYKQSFAFIWSDINDWRSDCVKSPKKCVKASTSSRFGFGFEAKAELYKVSYTESSFLTSMFWLFLA